MIKKCKCCEETILNKDGLVDLDSKKLYCSKDCYNEHRSNKKIIREKLKDPNFFTAMINSIKGEMVALDVELDENGNFISPNAKTFDDEDYRI